MSSETTAPPRIFKATYSGVPVYEMLCKSVAVMRRQSDSYLNATQILKVAGFDKPQRTRILEREVQIGQHEKVQGGYGKYQGTWVPLERGQTLAKLYEVDDVLAPILEFVKGKESPPLAPKHVTAASSRPRKPRETRIRKKPKHYDEDISDIEAPPQQSPKVADEKRLRVTVDEPDELPAKRTRLSNQQQSKPPIQKQHEEIQVFQDDDDDGMSEKTYGQKLLDYFMSSQSGVSSLLLHPPRDLDINIIIDDDGHTSLHWAAALARVNIVKIMIDNNVDINRVNYKGQTALMRSVLFTNNFEAKSFETLLSLLQKTIFHIDKKDQTVFHHIATTASLRGKVHASRYYMESLIDKLNANRSELISILNVQDVSGDTALTIASRVGNKKLVKILIDAGASTEIVNEEGMSAKDYLNELEKSRDLSPPPLLTSESMINETDTREILRQKVEAMYKQASSVTAPGNTSVPPISEVFDSFAESYERDLTGREKLIQKKKMELNLFRKRLEDTKRALLESSSLDTQVIEVTERRGEALEAQLKKFLQFSQGETLKCYIAQQEGDDGSIIKMEREELNKTFGILKHKLDHLKKSRQEYLENIIQLLSQIPPKLYQDYKRLISTCCNVSYENVDSMLSPLLASFDEVEN
ncbi:apses-domain-containing protein [Backusella circina FSU 941]|nr:apses-domain-containing protein [Backusella circina FSU 941]